jgi:hypothetical protein
MVPAKLIVFAEKRDIPVEGVPVGLEKDRTCTGISMGSNLIACIIFPRYQIRSISAQTRT